jgi:hypothetical protein
MSDWLRTIQVCLLMALIAVGASTCSAIERVGDQLIDIGRIIEVKP